MKKSVWFSFLVSAAFIFTSSCNSSDPSSNVDPQAVATYQSVLGELQQNIAICKVDTGSIFSVNGTQVVPDDSDNQSFVYEAFEQYQPVVAALGTVGVSLEFVNDPNLPSGCHWSDLALQYNLGSSSFLVQLSHHVLTKEGQPSPTLKQYKTKVDVIRISVTAKSAKELNGSGSEGLNDANAHNPSKFVLETDPKTGMKKRVFTVYVNPGYAFSIYGSGLLDILFDFNQPL